jgi:hypothetical protein
MREFNLADAKAGKPVVTRDGRATRFMGIVNGKSPVFAVTFSDGSEVVYTYEQSGKFTNNPFLDLVMKPEKKEYWVNVYREDNGEAGTPGLTHPSREKAFENRDTTTQTYLTSVLLYSEEV